MRKYPLSGSSPKSVSQSTTYGLFHPNLNHSIRVTSPTITPTSLTASLISNSTTTTTTTTTTAGNQTTPNAIQTQIADGTQTQTQTQTQPPPPPSPLKRPFSELSATTQQMYRAELEAVMESQQILLQSISPTQLTYVKPSKRVSKDFISFQLN